MLVLHTIEEVRQLRSEMRQQDVTLQLALVPTMGALHEGHLSLVRAARAQCDRVMVSIFVNPLQFGPGEDLDKYPRTLAKDLALLEGEGVDAVFAPKANEMYPQPMETVVDLPELGARLDGASRPGHFRGVATVVMKLFNIVQPDVAFFGQKDAAQVAVLRTMVHDLNVPVRMVVGQTVRDADGLALSSRNRYLSEEERQSALVLSRALHAARQTAEQGVTDVRSLRDVLMQELRREPAVLIDYVALVDPATLLPITDVRGGVLLAVAAWVGTTRLIDNLLLDPMPMVVSR
jgi:pantoate--beta-alanine ligase